MTQSKKRMDGWPDKRLEPGGSYFHRNRPSRIEKPVFMVDLDSTIFAMEDVMRDCVRLVTGVYPEPAHTWECEVAWGVSQETSGKIWDLVWQHDMKPYDGAFNFLRLLGEKYKVVSLSTRKLGEARNHGIAMTEDLPVDQKIWTASPDEKGERVRAAGAVYFLDDSPSNHFAVRRKTPLTDLLLLDRPWNQSQDIAPIWRRVHSYEEVLKIALE